MGDAPGLLWGTILLRPYVFAFLAAYLLAGSRDIGWKKTLAYIPIGYSLAWLSEFSSIHCGFPYGDYFYRPDTIDRELWVFGVPFMDSLSYVFLSYCSYSLAILMMNLINFGTINPVTAESLKIRFSWRTLLLGAFLFMLLDVVIDPVALRGDRWFLGLIYGYRHEGYYFGIPISNFGGWLIVGITLVFALQTLERTTLFGSASELIADRPSWTKLLGPALYFSVLIFNISITFYIGELLLGFVDMILLTCLLVWIYFCAFGKSPRISFGRMHARIFRRFE